MNLKTKILLAATVLMMSLPIAAQEVQSRHAVPGHRYLKEYWGRSELYLQHQAWYMLDLADKTLNENTPSLKINNEREMSLLMIDAVTHEPKPIENPAVLDFLAKRMNHVIADLDKPIKGKKTVRIYKLYNCSMLFRTKDLTIAVDLNGRDGKLIPDEIMEKIVDKIDILFYTHNHYDHIDNHVRDICHKKGVPIYGTEETFKNDPKINHIRFDDLHTFDITVPKGKVTVNVLPGHQDALQNNIWIVTLPNGKVVGATGDQWQDEGNDLKWLKDIHKRLPKIDILAMDCWIHDYDEHVADFNPRLLISQHENEIGAHGIDHREAYWMTIYKNTHFHKNLTPYVLMTWGEWYDYK
ncbi:MAG: MBL fold metallo-hydrolase [Bacteroidales bacterium]|nr:MBL fold metallo-hydrolase [Bacteroidales bacterium]